MLKWLISFVWPQKYKMLLAIFFGVISNFTVLLIPVIGTVGLLQLWLEPKTDFLPYFGAILLCGLIRGLARYAEQYLNHDLAFSLLAQVRQQIFSKVRTLQAQILVKKDSGDLLAALTSDVEALEVFFAHTLSPCAIYLVSLGLNFWCLAQFNLRAAWLVLLAQVVVGCGLPALSWWKNQHLGKNLQNNLAQLNQALIVSCDSLTDTKQYGLMSKQLTTLKHFGQKYNASHFKQIKLENLLAYVGEVILILTSVTILALGIEQQQAPTLVAVSTIFSLSCFGPALALNNLGAGLLAPLGSAKRLYALLKQTPSVTFKPTSALINPQVLQLTDVCFGYTSSKIILEQLNLQLQTGEIIGLGGKSGSGKTTLLNLLKRYYDPSSGKIAYEATDLKDLSEENLRKLQGIMQQDTFIFTGTIAQNIALAKPKATLAEIKQAAQKANLASFIAQLPDGYATLIGPNATKQLSDGQRQRLGLARLFLKDAPFWLLDEPTSRLDYLNEREIMQNLRQNTANKAVLLISHRATTLQNADVCYDIIECKIKRRIQNANC